MSSSRRDALKFGLGLAAVPVAVATAETGGACPAAPLPAWARGAEGQRVPDLGDGRFLNPIFAGDYPDPTILKDGDDYYTTHSSFEASPGLLIWHSRDLVNWRPVGPALTDPPGVVFAVELVKHDGRYFIYIPFIPGPWSSELLNEASIYVIWADRIEGPWSRPIDLGIRGYIDPGHIVGEDGERYLFLSSVARVRLSADGISTAGEIDHAYDGWRYPDEWITEAYALEGPKLFRRGGYFYLISAVGGTAGPPTGHMVIAARSRSVLGPWENCPHNPIVRTQDASERWWSRGHATIVEGPNDSWWMIYHGYENGYRTLGRQVLLEPIEWNDDGWFHATGGDLSQPLPKPRQIRADRSGFTRSDRFARSNIGTRWTFYSGGPSEAARAQFGRNGLLLAAKGDGPHNCSPLTQMVGDLSYEIRVHMELVGEAEGGLLLFYNDRLFLGMGHDGQAMKSYRGGKASYWREPAPFARAMHLKIVNERNIVTMYYSVEGASWTRHAVRSEVSGYNANTIDDLASLRPALFAARSGAVRFSDFSYRGLP